MVESVVAVMRRPVLAVLVAAVVLGGLLAAPSSAGGGHKDVHKPPYKKGPSGGDEFNFVQADAASGEISVLRVFPGVPPVVGCTPEPSAGWAMLRVPHHAAHGIEKVTVNFDAQLDPYAWVTGGVRDKNGEWLGVKKFQGPFSGSESLVVKLHEQPARDSDVVIEFGVQLGDACPQVGGAHVSFPSIEVE